MTTSLIKSCGKKLNDIKTGLSYGHKSDCHWRESSQYPFLKIVGEVMNEPGGRQAGMKSLQNWATQGAGSQSVTALTGRCVKVSGRQTAAR